MTSSLVVVTGHPKSAREAATRIDHPIHRRWFAEDLVRLRRGGERRRFLASQRAGRVDPNPHQIDAVVFALERLEQGGCILADEVGLGKTIEAGLVIAQRRAEGAQRILLVTPKPLLGQWRDELAVLFGIEGREARTLAEAEGPGVFLVGRELAGSEAGSAMLRQSGAFDLAVIDEAHEIFAGIYRRYDRRGQVKAESRYAKTASRVKAVLADTPVLLLTATPIQNTLTELWGLVQYVEPTGTLLGDLPTFRTVFCDGDDRTLRPGREDELRRRIAEVCQRTLRRQAEEFMAQSFVQRRARLFEYTMTPAEKELYDEVTAWLLSPDSCAFGGTHRRLLVIGFHRRMASSIRALRDSLHNVAERLRKRLRGSDEQTLRLWREDEEDLEEDPGDATPDGQDLAAATGQGERTVALEGTKKLADELARVEAMIARAEALDTDSKAAALVEALRFVLSRDDQSGKAVIFTEALSTQEYLRDLLVERGVVTADEVTLFRGQNSGPRTVQALEQWEAEIGSRLPPHARPTRDVAVRMALVWEFHTRSKVFIATEAGAKGLNLQFCETVVNYDLPWNPQRIEQRIGRCHRYGQRRDVTVINFLARDNAAQRLVFDILSRKLDLFGTVLDASDNVLHDPGHAPTGALVGALGLELQAQLESIYAQAGSTRDVEDGLGRLGEVMGRVRTQLEQTQSRTAGLIETRLDETVRAAFKQLAEDVPAGLAELDRDLEAVLVRYLQAIAAPWRRREEQGGVRIVIGPCPRLPESLVGGTEVWVGRPTETETADVLHLGHPLLRAAVDEARRATRMRQRVRLKVENEALRPLVGRRGRAVVVRVDHAGFEPQGLLVPLVILEGDAEVITGSLARELLLSPPTDVGGFDPPLDLSDKDIEDGLQEALFVAQGEVEPREQQLFEQALERIERFMEDRISALQRRRLDLVERLDDAQGRRDAAVGAEARTKAEREATEVQEEIEMVQSEIARLRSRDDHEWATWWQRAHERRYAVPGRTEVLDVELEVA